MPWQFKAILCFHAWKFVSGAAAPAELPAELQASTHAAVRVCSRDTLGDANSCDILEFCLEITKDHGLDNDLSSSWNSWAEECFGYFD
jgi:hypothetical protein